MAPVRDSYKSLTISTKIKIINDVEKKLMPKGKLAEKYEIPNSTLSSIIKNKTKLIDAFHKFNESSSRQRIRPAKHEMLESQVFDFFSRNRVANLPVSGPVLMEKAISIANKLGIEGFQASGGWLNRFKGRFNITSLAMCGEAQHVNEEEVSTWLNNRREIIEKYQPKDIYNMDETGIFYNVLPERTLALKGEKCSGGKRSKERLTVALCCNADGSDKIKPTIIGKARNPRAFKNVAAPHLFVNYENNKKAWMTRDLFKSWLTSFQRKMAAYNRNVLLILDNCSAHNVPEMNCPNVHLLYLPSNTTSVLQPLDQGIIQNLKHHYRKKLNTLHAEA